AGRTPTRVIDHGVEVPPGTPCTLELPRGITVVNNIVSRGRRLGSDVFARVREDIPIDLYGMGWREAGGRGELPHGELPEEIGRHRFFFNPIRYTSLGLSVLE